MPAIYGRHYFEVERLHRRLRSLRAKFFVGVGQIRSQCSAVRKRESRNPVAGDTRGTLIAKMNPSGEQPFSMRRRAPSNIASNLRRRRGLGRTRDGE